MAALQRLASPEGRRVLELGRGDGRLTFEYARAAELVLAVDTDEERIAEAVRARPPELAGRLTFVGVGAADVAAPPYSFDVALFCSSL